MKKVLYLIGLAVAMLTANTAKAQFDHLSVGLELGTTGYGFELATNATPYLGLRTGLTTMPRIGATVKDVHYKDNGVQKSTDVKGTSHITDWKLLADYYPFANNSFHLTAGFYVGRSEILTAHNTIPLELAPGDGLEIGDRIATPDENGYARANLKVNAFKPYLGVGFGRSISKHKFNVACDLGVQFWGKPKAYAWSDLEQDWLKVSNTDVEDDDFNDALDKITGIGVYPVLNIRLIYNIF